MGHTGCIPGSLVPGARLDFAAVATPGHAMDTGRPAPRYCAESEFRVEVPKHPEAICYSCRSALIGLAVAALIDKTLTVRTAMTTTST